MRILETFEIFLALELDRDAFASNMCGVMIVSGIGFASRWKGYIHANNIPTMEGATIRARA
jgi:hypothetical protein